MDRLHDKPRQPAEWHDKRFSVSVEAGGLLALRIDDAPDLQRRCPEQYDALIECTALVNFRRIEVGEKPILTLMLSGQFPNPS